MKKSKNLLVLLLVLLALLCLYTCQQCTGNSKNNQSKASTDAPFIHPPLAEEDVPFTHYEITAAQGDTLLHPSGSLLLFPPEAFVNANGKPVKGKVSVAYREFPDPVDIYRAGIPMGYDTLGQQHYFESSGMCEIKASQNGVPVFVNPGKKPTLHLATKQRDLYTLYYLDTVSRKWIPKGSNEALDLKQETVSTFNANTSEEVLPTPPVPPAQAEEGQPVLHVYIDPASFKELLCYDNQLFQVDTKRSKMNPADTAEEWNDLQLQKTTQKGLYLVAFSNARKKANYYVKTVLKGVSFEKALKKYKQLDADYRKAVAENKAQLKKSMEAAAKDSMETLAQLERNRKVEAINRMIDEENKRIALVNQSTIKYNKKKLNSQYEAKIYEQNAALVRTFEINNFGTWNCDRPLQLNLNKANWQYENEAGESLEPELLSVAYKGMNGVVAGNDMGGVYLSENRLNVIMGMHENHLVYAAVAPQATNASGQIESKKIRMIAPKNDVLARAQIRELLQ